MATIKKRLTLEEHRKHGALLKRQHEELQELFKLAADGKLGRDADGKAAAKLVQRLVEYNMDVRASLDSILSQDHPRDYDLGIYYEAVDLRQPATAGLAGWQQLVLR